VMPSNFSLSELIAVGFTATELCEAGIPQVQLDGAGLALELVVQGRSIKDVQSSGCVCPSDERMVKALSAAGQQTNLNSLKNLERLDASRKQQVTDQEGQALVWAVASHTTNSLQELILACTDVGDLTCKAIGQLLRCYSSLTMVDLHDNAITDEGAIVLANSLRFNRSLVGLRISENRLGVESAKAFASSLKLNSTLTTLSLDTGALPIQQIKGLSGRISNELNLSAVGIGRLGSVVLSELVQEYQESVGVLKLDRNNIGPDGGEWIGKMLRDNNVMQELHLRFCGLKMAGIKAITEALKSNTCLEKLYLLANNLGSEGATSVAEMLKENTTLRLIDVSDNRLSKQSKDALYAISQQRDGLVVHT